MSLLRTKSLQIGQDGTATNNFTLYQPGVPDGTLRIGNGNNGSVTDAITLLSSGNVTLANDLTVSGDLVTNSVPAFVARMSTTQAISDNTWTKIEFNTEDADIGDCYDHTTNYRFTVPANQGGLYQINFWAYIACGTTNCRNVAIRILKNGASELKRGYLNFYANDATGGTVGHSSVLNLNAGDYLEVYGYANSTDNVTQNISSGSYSSFSGFKLIQQV